jgi:hypothetical protein
MPLPVLSSRDHSRAIFLLLPLKSEKKLERAGSAQLFFQQVREDCCDRDFRVIHAQGRFGEWARLNGLS